MFFLISPAEYAHKSNQEYIFISNYCCIMSSASPSSLFSLRSNLEDNDQEKFLSSLGRLVMTLVSICSRRSWKSGDNIVGVSCVRTLAKMRHPFLHVLRWLTSSGHFIPQQFRIDSYAKDHKKNLKIKGRYKVGVCILSVKVENTFF